MTFKNIFQITLLLSYCSSSVATGAPATKTDDSFAATATYIFKTSPLTLIAGNMIGIGIVATYYRKELKEKGFKKFVKEAWANKRKYKKLWGTLALLGVVDTGYIGLQNHTPKCLKTNYEKIKASYENIPTTKKEIIESIVATEEIHSPQFKEYSHTLEFKERLKIVCVTAALFREYQAHKFEQYQIVHKPASSPDTKYYQTFKECCEKDAHYKNMLKTYKNAFGKLKETITERVVIDSSKEAIEEMDYKYIQNILHDLVGETGRNHTATAETYTQMYCGNLPEDVSNALIEQELKRRQEINFQTPNTFTQDKLTQKQITNDLEKSFTYKKALYSRKIFLLRRYLIEHFSSYLYLPSNLGVKFPESYEDFDNYCKKDAEYNRIFRDER